MWRARSAVVVTSAVRQAAVGLPGVEFVRLGNRSLKGIAAEEVLFEARIEGPQGVDRVIDPVCGMELDPALARARSATSDAPSMLRKL
jgi:hypothetical protein